MAPGSWTARRMSSLMNSTACFLDFKHSSSLLFTRTSLFTSCILLYTTCFSSHRISSHHCLAFALLHLAYTWRRALAQFFSKTVSCRGGLGYSQATTTSRKVSRLAQQKMSLSGLMLSDERRCLPHFASWCNVFIIMYLSLSIIEI